MANVERTQMMTLIKCENSLGQYVCELVFGINVFDLGVEINSIEQSNNTSVGSGNMSHCKPSSFNDHFDHRFIAKTHTTKLLDVKIPRLRTKSLSRSSIFPKKKIRFGDLYQFLRT